MSLALLLLLAASSGGRRKEEKREKMLEARNEGKAAYYEGKAESDNPHKGSEFWLSWNEGWHESKREDNLKKIRNSYVRKTFSEWLKDPKQ